MSISLTDPFALQTYLHQQLLVPEEVTITEISAAGDGNMNRVIRVGLSNGKSLIVKQAEPFVVKYPSIAAPADRLDNEALFYKTIQPFEKLVTRMPELFHSDPEQRLLILSDLGTASDLMHLYRPEQKITLDQLEELISFLETLHRCTQDHNSLSKFGNKEMRALNHQHIFVLPMHTDNGLDLAAVHPSLVAPAARFREQKSLLQQMDELGHHYLAEGRYLLHGDYYYGSFLKTNNKLFVIDTEFCFAGPAEWDYGVLLAHLYLSDQSSVSIFHLEQRAASLYNLSLVKQFAGAEIFRRLLGLAQLPLGLEESKKPALLEKAVKMIINN